MRTVGIIAEYNPLHTGHEYQIRQAREQSNADYVVIVMSPDFVQRGTPAVFSKYMRTESALRCGADLVIELPVCYASGSAEFFAQGAVALLDRLGIDALCFGSETPDPDLFLQAAEVLNSEPDPFCSILQTALKRGATYPAARQEALSACLGSSAASILSTPNNLLGTEYCRALHAMHSSMVPFPILRKGSGYHSTELQENDFVSASAIRSAIAAGSSDDLSSYIPESSRELFASALAHPLFSDDFLPVLDRILLSEESFSDYQDISPELASRMNRLRFACIGKSYAERSAILKTKQITESRIRRALLHLLLGIHTADLDLFRSLGTVFYGRILGFRTSSSALLHELKTHGAIPLIAKNAGGEALLHSRYGDLPEQEKAAVLMYRQDLSASHQYQSILSLKYHLPFRTEYEHSPILL